ncbi:MAG: type II toxin-antitoxin system HicA family toxin [Acidobacteria bacterium]|nr:type II toxin-antitoxin system HicA family toxin [Acidobacteriota bacterium]
MKRRILLKRIASGAFQNVDFRDMISLVEGLGFRLSRVSGSHHVFSHPGIPELVNLQEVGGQVKPYQVKQVLRLVECYNLRLEDGS